jgi:DNA-binding response OmpR family regulator
MSSLNEKEILVIDDAPDIRLLARRILEGDGAVVRESESVEDGLMQASVTQPHLILLDLEFPGESGFEFLSARKAHAEWRDVPTIVLSGNRDRTSIVKSISLGATDYLLKPFRATLLLQKVRKALRLATFQTYTFPDGARPAAHVSVPAEVSRLSEVGFRIDSSAKLEPDELLRIECEQLATLGVEQAMIKTSTRPAQYNGDGRYCNTAMFTGVGEEFTKELRQKLKKPA